MTKDEKKDEMKNRISMALKDPILQQGFEIICKNLERKTRGNNLLMSTVEKVTKVKIELEKENAELKENIEYAKAVMREALDNATEYSRQIAEDFIAEGTK